MKLMRLIPMLFATLCVGCNAKNPNVKVLPPAEFKAAFEKDSKAVLIDVRTPEEYAEGHIEGAKLMNWLDEATFQKEAQSLDKEKKVYLYCRSGRRSNAAANYLAQLGFEVIDMQGGILAWDEAGFPKTTLETDVFFTNKDRRVAITFVKHGTLMIRVEDYVIHIDPVTMYSQMSDFPKADLLLVTHEHRDHYDNKAIELLKKADTKFLSNGRVAELSGQSKAMAVGDSIVLAKENITITATAAYNTSPNHSKFHPKGRDVGFLLDIDGLKIYVAGDTEDIPELAELRGVDIAFLPVNQPYTMTPAQCIKAIELLQPKIVYPYHYGETNLSPVAEHFRNNKEIEVRIRQMQ